jgi:hypothetical protein
MLTDGKKQSRFQKDLEKKTKLLKNTSSLFRKSCTNKLNSERFTKCPGDSKAMDFDPWISQASNHKVMSAELLPSVDYLLAPQKWVECPELACFQANMTGNPIFNGKIIRVIYRYIYVVYIHTRNVYYICTYYEFTCIYILCIHMCIYIYIHYDYILCVNRSKLIALLIIFESRNGRSQPGTGASEWPGTAEFDRPSPAESSTQMPGLNHSVFPGITHLST